MGVAQSAQREEKKEAAAAEGSGQVDDGHNDETVQNKEETSVIKRKADGSTEEVNGHSEDKIPAEDQDDSEKPLKEENRPLENVEDEPLKITEMDAKQNDMYKSFRRIFSNISLKWTVKRETAPNVPDKSNKEEPKRAEDVEEIAKETESENAEQDTDVNMKQETWANDSTSPTDVTSEDILENPVEKTAETKEAAVESTHQDTTSEEEPRSKSPSSPAEEEIISPIKRFFMSGIFSGLRTKNKPEEVEKHEEKLIDMGEKEVIETTHENVQDQQQDEEICPAVVEVKHDENELKDEILSTASSQMTDKGNLSNIVVEFEYPLKWLKMKQKSSGSSDSKLFDTKEHVSDQQLGPSVPPGNQKDSTQPPAEAAGEEEGAWASFKKLMTPKKRMKRSSLSNVDIQIPGLEEEPKPSESEQISDHSTENGKKRKDSSVSWDAVLCGAGRKRSQKMSDFEDEMPQIDIYGHKQVNGAKHEAAPPKESSKDVQILASFPKQAGSPSEIDGGSTWKSLKRLLTPKRKVKDEDVSKANTLSYNEVTEASCYDTDKDVASGDEDSETPAVVPLSEFNTVETEIHAQTQADMKSHLPEISSNELQQDLLDQMIIEVLSLDSLQTETDKVQDTDDALEKSATPATNEEPDDVTESVSKYQQLSDITEEGLNTETMATPTEEAARDDTIAEDLIEITSEAITAPEPAADITLADETEMISAVSQLTLESSKTSGKITPVTAEYDIMETDRILQQVVETVSVSPKEVPVCSDEPRFERIVGSVSRQILQQVLKEEPTILEMHRRLDAATIKTGLAVEEFDAINELAATSLTDSISEVMDIVSTEVASEVSTGELYTAETAADEIQVVNVTNTEGSEKDFETIIETHHHVERLPRTDTILHEVVETILMSPREVPVCSDELRSQIIVSSASHKVHETFVKEQPTILEMHRLDATAIKTGVAVEDLDAKTELAAASLTESISEVKDIVSTEVASEVSIGELDTAETAVDEIQVNVTNTEGSVTDLERIVETHHLVKCLSEINPALSTDVLPEGDKIVADVGSLVEAHQVETQPQNVDSQEADSADAAIADETKDGAMEQVVQTVTDTEGQILHNITDQIQAEDRDQLPVDGKELQQLAEEQATTIDSEGSTQLNEKESISEDMPLVETLLYQLKGETVPMTEGNAEAEKEDELEIDVTKTEHDQVSGAAEVVQTSTLDSEENSVQSPKEEVKSEDFPPAETGTVDPKKTTEYLTKVIVEHENKDLPANAVRSEHVPELDALQSESVQAVTLDSEDGSLQSHENEVKTKNPSEAETTTDDPKEEALLPTEAHLEPMVDSELGYVQKSEVLEAAQAATLDLVEDSVESPEKEVIPEDVPEGERIIDEPKDETVLSTEVSDESPEKEVIEILSEANTVTDEAKTETIILTDDNFDSADASKPGLAPEVLQAVKDVNLESEEGCVQTLPKNTISEDIPEAKTNTDEPKDDTVLPTEISLEPMVDSVPEHVPEPEVLQAVQAASSESEEGSVQAHEKNTILEDIPEAKTITDEPKEETILSREVSLEPMVDSVPEHVPEPEVLQAVQAASSESEEGSVQALEKEVISEDVHEAETITSEPKEETVLATVVSLEPVGNSEAGHVQESEVLEAAQAPMSTSVEGSVQSPKKEAIEKLPEAKTVTDEPKTETIILSDVSLDSADASKAGLAPEVLQAVQAASSESEEGSVQALEKEVISEHVHEAETITDEPKEETVLSSEVSLEPLGVSLPEHLHDLQVSEAVQAPILESKKGSVESIEKVISKNVPEAEIMTDEPKEEKVLSSEVSLEPKVDTVLEHVPEPEQAVQEATSESEEGSVQALEKEVIPEDVHKAETITDEPKDETVLSTKVSDESPEKEVIEKLPEANTVTDETKTETIILTDDNFDSADASKPGLAPEVLQAIKDVNLESEEGCVQTLPKNTISEDIPEAKTNTDEPKDDTVLPTEISLEPMVDSVPEHVPEPEVLQAVQAASSESEEGSVQAHEKEVISEDVHEAETITDEPKEETVLSSEVSLEPLDFSLPEHLHEHELEAATLESEEGKAQENESISDEIPKVVLTEEPKYEVQLSAVQVNVEQEKESEFPGIEINTDALEHVVACNLKDARNLVTFEDNQRIQVQVDDVNEKSAETIVDSVLEVGVTEVKEVIDVCQETVDRVDNLSATPEIEQELINEENNVTIQEDFQHVKEKSPETVPESAAASLEQEVIEKPDNITKAECQISEVADQTTMEDGTGTFRQRENTAFAVISDDPATGQQISINLMPTPDITGSLDVSSQDYKEDSEETKAPPITERILLMEQTDLSKAEVQEVKAEESTKPVYSTQRSESQNQTKVPSATVQISENTEPAAKLVSTEKASIMLEVDIKAMETVEPVEQIKSTDRVTCSVQETETIQSVRSTEKVFKSQPVLSKAAEPVEQIDKHDLDEWMNAGEVFYTQEDTEVEEHLETQTASEQEVKEGHGHEVEMAPTFKTDEDEGEQATHTTGEACDEDFAVADPASLTASVTTEND